MYGALLAPFPWRPRLSKLSRVTAFSATAAPVAETAPSPPDSATQPTEPTSPNASARPITRRKFFMAYPFCKLARWSWINLEQPWNDRPDVARRNNRTHAMHGSFSSGDHLTRA